MIYIEFAGSVEAEHISLIDMEGKEVKDYSVKSQASRIELGVSKALSGLHLIRIVLENGQIVTKKIMIL